MPNSQPLDFWVDMVRHGEDQRLSVTSRSAVGESEPHWVNVHDLVNDVQGDTLAWRGKRLYSQVFSAGMRDLLRKARDVARKDTWVRILLAYPSDPILHALPWETMHDGNVYLAVADYTSLARYLRQSRPVKPLTVEPPLRALLTTASPANRSPLDLDSEIGDLEARFGHFPTDLAHLTSLPHIRQRQLRRAFGVAATEGNPFYIWHHAGHGEVGDDSVFYLVLEGDDGKISASRVLDSLETDELRLVVLNVCCGADRGGLTTLLAEINVPATLGFSASVKDYHAVEFANTFYRSLLDDGASVDWAVREARRTLMSTGADAWSTAVLFLRTQQPVLFLQRTGTTSDERQMPTRTTDHRFPPPEHEGERKITILVFSANPENTDRLLLNEEIRDIAAKIRASEHRGDIRFVSALAARPGDLIDEIDRHQPHIIHFSGHGNSDSLWFQNDQGGGQSVGRGALVKLFRVMGSKIRGAVLNACDTALQAESVIEHIDFAVGMSGRIDDIAARRFAVAFYGALGDGRCVRDAFDRGHLAITLDGSPDGDIPKLYGRRGLDLKRLFLIPHGNN